MPVRPVEYCDFFLIHSPNKIKAPKTMLMTKRLNPKQSAYEKFADTSTMPYSFIQALISSLFSLTLRLMLLLKGSGVFWS